MTTWVDGRLVADDEPVVGAFDPALRVGLGVFETAKVASGSAFAVTRHLDRLVRSASGLGITVDLDVVRAGIATVMAAGGDLALGRLRITIAARAGSAPFGQPGATDGRPPSVIVTVEPLQPWPPSAVVVTVPWPRNERAATAGLKTTSYAENMVALARAAELGADEAVLANTRSELCEASASNVFYVAGGALLTPSLDSGCLAGVTRALLLEWLPGSIGVPVVETRAPLREFVAADEAFLASSTRDVQPVRVVDGRPFPAAPGPITRAAAEIFSSRAAADPDP